MIESTLFKAVDIVTKQQVLNGDVLIENGKIAAIGPSISASAQEVITDSGLTLLPGVIDPHVHFRDPGATHKEDLASGSMAAAAGGVTSFFDMPNTNPATISCESLDKKKQHAANTSIVNYNFFIGATADNLQECIKAENIPGIKIYVGSSTGTLLVDQRDKLDAIFKQSPHLIAVHSEDEAMIQQKLQEYQGSTNVHDHQYIRSAEGALKCTQMLTDLAIKHQQRLHICHLTTWQEVDWLKQLKKYPFITNEVTPQHLWTFSPNIYDQWGTKAQINPPIRSKEHQQGLLKGLLEGVIDCMGSDHAPHLASEKNQPFGQAPSGMPGVQTSLYTMLNAVNLGLFSLQQVVNWMCQAPARIYNIQNKGYIAEGYDADCVLVDLKAKTTMNQAIMASKAKWSVFEGQTFQGKPIATFVNGNCVYREGDFFTQIKGLEVKLDSKL